MGYLSEQSRPGHGSAPGASRRRVLTLLQDAGGPLAADDVAGRLGLHVNTARFHLDGLEAEELVVREVEERDRPGRPRVLFTAVADVPADGRSYALLAQILTGSFAEKVPEPAEAARDAGAAWGRYLARTPPPSRRVEASEAIDAVVEQLHDIGFGSRTEGASDEVRIDIYHCPFLEVAKEHSEVVCSVHLGLMRGMLEQMRAPVEADSLEPFVEPSRCIARMHARA